MPSKATIAAVFFGTLALAQAQSTITTYIISPSQVTAANIPPHQSRKKAANLRLLPELQSQRRPRELRIRSRRRRTREYSPIRAQLRQHPRRHPRIHPRRLRHRWPSLRRPHDHG